MNKVTVIEVDGTKLDPNAKYIFQFDPAYIHLHLYDVFLDELDKLIPGNYTCIPVKPGSISVVEVLPKESNDPRG